MSLIVLISAVMLTTLLLGAVATYLHASHKVETEMQAAIAVGGRIAHNAVDDEEDSALVRRRLERLVAYFNGDRHLKAEVRSPAGTTLLASEPAPPERTIPEWFYALLAGESRTVTIELPDAVRDLGHLVLRTDSRNEVTEVWNDMLNTLTILFVFTAMTLALVSALIGRALRPLEDLSRAFGEVGAKRFAAHLPEAGPIELKRVYHGFNDMVDELNAAERQNRALHEQLSSVQEEERAEIARDLHDEIGPILFSADVDARTVERSLPPDSIPDVRERVRRIRDGVGQIQRHVRDILSRLRAGPIAELGLAMAVDQLIAFWRGCNPAIDFDVSIAPTSFGQPVDGTIYRIIQESVSNAVRHGSATRIAIRVMKQAGDITVAIEDNGTGMSDMAGRPGYGIAGMRERLALLGGALEILPRRDGPGVSVKARVPARTNSTVAQRPPAAAEEARS